MNYKRWSESFELQEAWRSTWNISHMAAGLDVLKIAAYETTFRFPEGTEALTAGALRDAAREGFKAAIMLIERMMEPAPQTSGAPAPAYGLVPDFEEDGPPRQIPAGRKIQ